LKQNVLLFLGGHMEDSDGHEIECALRETEEEIGLKSKYVKIWGTGSQMTPSFGTSIVPVIAEIRNFNESMVKANPDEVEQILNIPLQRLIDPNLIRHTQFRTESGKLYAMPVYLGGIKRFWGFSAYVSCLKTKAKINVK
jgi:nudix motif 8